VLSSISNWANAPVEGILFDDLSGDGYYNAMERYGSSKLANIMFAAELNRRYSADNVVGTNSNFLTPSRQRPSRCHYKHSTYQPL
jgi:hypothetical protein